MAEMTVHPGSHLKSSQASLLSRFYKHRFVYLALLPAVLLLLIFDWYPAFSAMYNSLFWWNGGKLHQFVGLQNFQDLYTDRTFRIALQNLVFFVFFRIIMQAIVPFIAAEMIINLRSQRWSNWWKIIFVFPMVVPMILNYLIWRFIYNPQVGLLNQALTLLGLESLTRAWLSDPNIAMWALSFVRFPWLPTLQFLIILGGLQAIPKEVLESSEIDGAGLFQRVLRIDIPMIRGQIMLAIILTAIFMTQRFDLFLVMTDGGPGYSTMMPALHLYHSAFNFLEFGYASAIGVILFVVMLILTVLNLKISQSNAG